MPHKGTPIRYGQKQPVRNRQQGAGEISPRHKYVDMQARKRSFSEK
jgi:hypothetical protein